MEVLQHSYIILFLQLWSKSQGDHFRTECTYSFCDIATDHESLEKQGGWAKIISAL